MEIRLDDNGNFDEFVADFDRGNGDMFTLQEFVLLVRSGALVDYDGNGYYSNGEQYFRNAPAVPSGINRDGPDYRYSHVAWFNR